MIKIIKGRIAKQNEFDTDQAFAVDIDIYNGSANSVLTKQRVVTLYSLKDTDLFEMINILEEQYKEFFDMKSIEVEYVGVSKIFMVYEITIASGKINVKKEG